MTETKTMPPKIAAALVKAQSLVHRVGKDGENKFHRYKYTSAEALIEAAREPLAQAGLAILEMGHTMRPPVVIDSLEWVPVDPAKTGKDDRFVATPSKDIYPAMAEIRFVVTHEEGESWEMPVHEVPVIPEAGRPWDKALFTAKTFGLGYALRGLLKIPRSGDPDETEARDDADQRDDRNTNQRGAKGNRGPTADEKREAERQKYLDAMADDLRTSEMPPVQWATRYGAKSVEKVGMETVQKHFVPYAVRNGMNEGEALAELAKVVAASKR